MRVGVRVFLALVAGVRPFVLQFSLIVEEPLFCFIGESVWLVVVPDVAFERQFLVEIMILVAVEMPMRVRTPGHASQLLEIVSAVLLPELVIRLDPRVIQVNDGAAVLLSMSLFAALLALHASRPALRSDVAELVAAEAGARVAVVVVVVAQAEGTFGLHPFLQAVFGDVALLAASEALHQPVLVALLLQALEVTRRPLPLLLLLHLFLSLLLLLLPLLPLLLLLLGSGSEPVLLLLRDLLQPLVEVQIADVLAGLVPFYPIGEQRSGFVVLHGIVVIGFFDQQYFLLGKCAVRVVLDSFQLVDVDVVVLGWRLALLHRFRPPLLYLFICWQVLL